MNPSTVNIHEAAGLMKVHPDTVCDLINRGVLPAARIGRAYVLLTRDVLEYLENEIIRQTAERMVSRNIMMPARQVIMPPPRRRGAGRW